jgi:parallel beta-helix repeat protein
MSTRANGELKPRGFQSAGMAVRGLAAVVLIAVVVVASVAFGAYASSAQAATSSPTRYQQTDSHLAYAGTWSTFSTSSASGGSYTRASSSTSSVTVTFSGTYLAWIATKGTTLGKAFVSLDGGSAQSINLAASAVAYQQNVWNTGTLASGTHTVKIWRDSSSASGKYISVDAFDVAGTLTQPPTQQSALAATTRYQQTDSRFAYQGTWSTFSTSSASGGSYTRASSNSSSVTVTFNGTYLAWIATTGTTLGKAWVSLDGGTATSINLARSVVVYQQKVWNTGTLPAGTHTVRIWWDTGNAAGKYISIDAVDVIGTLTQASSLPATTTTTAPPTTTTTAPPTTTTTLAPTTTATTVGQSKGQVYYVDASGGNDGNSGLAPDTAWKTIAKVNAASLSPGDAVLFKRGEVWNCTQAEYALYPTHDGTASASIAYGAYGSGSLPIIRGRNYVVPESAMSSSWVRHPSVPSAWYITLADDPSRLFLGNVEYWPSASEAGVNATKRWYYGTVNGQGHRLLVYSAEGNPASVGLTVQQGNSAEAVYVKGRKYLVFENLDLQGGCAVIRITAVTSAASRYITFQNCSVGYRSAFGIQISAGGSPVVNCDHITIANCNIASGAPVYNPGTANYCNADGINVSGCDYVSIHDNTLTDWFHSAIYFIDRDGGTVKYGEVYGNKISSPKVAYCRGLSTDGSADGKVSYNKFYNNVIQNTGIRSQINGDHNEVFNNVIDTVTQPSYPSYQAGEGIQLQGYRGPCHDNIIRNNIIRNCSGPGIAIADDSRNVKHDNIIEGNTIVDCGSDLSRSLGYLHIGIRIDNAPNVGGNSFASNMLVDSAGITTVIMYRGTAEAVEQFNANNGDNSDVISGNSWSQVAR